MTILNKLQPRRLLLAACGLLAMSVLAAPAAATVVRVTTPLGDFDIQLLEDEAPNTVANFLNYVDDGDYENSFIHRSVGLPDIIQGGGFVFVDGQVDPIPQDAPIANEFGRSNLRGTVAMARVGGLPDSATSQWFINISDDNDFLDDVDGGFTVFGEVIGDGMDVVDAIAALPTIFSSTNNFTDWPVIDFTPGSPAQAENVVFTDIQRVSDFTINPGLNGSWFNPDTSGQGFFLDVFPEAETVFLAWFTYDIEAAPMDATAVVGDPNHRWLTAQGSFSGNRAELDVTLTTGGLFDAATDTMNSEPGSYGSLILTFDDCANGTLRYDLFAINLSGEIPLSRIADDNVPLCEAIETIGDAGQ